jgi:pseudouridine-5'-phosphate glycosidase
MNKKVILPEYYVISDAVMTAKQSGKPILALESTVITHGLPFPQNIVIARELESIALQSGVTPATIAVLDGKIHIGLSDQDLELLAEKSSLPASHPSCLKKIAWREISLALAGHWSGGTTVSSTLYLAYTAGIKVFSTGGIGGVHRDWNLIPDVSADLHAIANFPVIVVTAGCKAILDIEATIEYLETLSIPVFGWQTNTCPAFYSRETSIKLERVDEINQIIRIYNHQIALAQLAEPNRLPSGMIIMNPIPAADEIPAIEIEPFIQQALQQAKAENIKGKALTPWLLQRMYEITQGKSVTANLALIKNNVSLGSKIALAMK